MLLTSRNSLQIAPAMNTSQAPSSRPWNRDGMVHLVPDASNFQQWKFLAELTTNGPGAPLLLTREPTAGNVKEQQLALHLKTFLEFTVDPVFLAELIARSAFQACEYLTSLASATDVLQVSRDSPITKFEDETSASAYIATQRRRHDALASTDSPHFLSSSRQYLVDILSG